MRPRLMLGLAAILLLSACAIPVPGTGDDVIERCMRPESERSMPAILGILGPWAMCR